MSLTIALALFGAAPAVQAPVAQPIAAVEDKDMAEVDRAADLIAKAKPAEAVALLDALIAKQDNSRKGDARTTYCARSPAESLGYMIGAAKEKKEAVVLPQSSCYSIFLKGFALIDLNRSDEARVFLERAVAMAPSNAHFLGELAEWYKNRKDWPKSRALFQRTVDAAALSPENRRAFDRTRGMRGLAYILIEEGKLDEAEKIYRQCLQIDPNDTRSKQQLDYIAGRRGKKI